jgi:hypothetical protein
VEGDERGVFRRPGGFRHRRWNDWAIGQGGRKPGCFGLKGPYAGPSCLVNRVGPNWINSLPRTVMGRTPSTKAAASGEVRPLRRSWRLRE